MEQTNDGSFTTRDAFKLYLRSGRRVPPNRIVQVKFNPYHDPKNGQFTFKDGAGGSANVGQQSGQQGPASGRENPRIVADEHARQQRAWAADPRNPINQESYTVKSGDTLTHIAAMRGISVAQVAQYNGISPDAVIRPGQKLILPTQKYVDQTTKAFQTEKALELYRQDHGGQMPPSGKPIPSVAQQVYGPGAREVIDYGYTFVIDGEGRTRLVSGTITRNSDQARSNANQLAAGGSDRLPTDEGGHYIAREFNGPTAAYNHFAQDGSFNRSGYRKLENLWGRATRRGDKVRVSIGPIYLGMSKRPDEIVVSYNIAGETTRDIFPNRTGN